MSTILEDDSDDSEEWISIDDDNDDDNDSEDEDNKLTYHHNEPEELKDLDWNDLPNFIRRKSIANNIIIRLPYKGTQFYLGSEKDFQQKETDYMKRTGAYKLIDKLDGIHRTASQTCLADIVEQVEIKLDNLLDSKCIDEVHYMKMNISRLSVRMHYLYFVPEIHKEGIPVRPIMICNDGPTMNIVRYITPILWSIFDRATNCRRFSNGAVDVIHAIEHYAQIGHLIPRTLFVTFNMDELMTVFRHDETIAALKSLLVEQLPDQMIDGLTIDTILELVHFVLKKQFVVYNYALYQQIHGGASGLPLTMFLTFINVFYGQHRDLVKSLKEKNEFFGRYREQAIITWHGSEGQFRTLLKKSIGIEHTRNLVTISIGSKVHFHDLEISYKNNGGILESKVYYDSAIDTLPNVSDKPMENQSKQLYAVLYRAVRCSSDVETFHHELCHIQLSFLTSGFTSEFIHSNIERFYQEFGIQEKFFSLFLNDDDEYNNLRQRIIQDVEQQMKLKQQREEQKKYTLFVPCPRFIHQESRDIFKQGFQDLWKKYFGNESQTKHVQIKWIERTTTPLAKSDFLINKRPPLRLLTLSKSEVNKKRYHPMDRL
ncbi:unnamed protein product [Rotaria sordida]|uniref:Reverse transcriptase domain-containing protein n=5 Tax=Rotaria sordida TaxID=392033 RepID=A0A815PRP9_9BILA|nr:unnamed protein product [Rotaria sordida]CAF1452422.1 unnamed protein product [Rotaria sordida]CAF1467694.1 unnamed protein product [Rotaria sordida]